MTDHNLTPEEIRGVLRTLNRAERIASDMSMNALADECYVSGLIVGRLLLNPAFPAEERRLDEGAR